MPDISTPNLDYGNMVEAWDINDALMGGTLYMRQLGEQYLPRWPKEDKEDYKKTPRRGHASASLRRDH